jgi:hypothetical protein
LRKLGRKLPDHGNLRHSQRAQIVAHPPERAPLGSAAPP